MVTSTPFTVAWRPSPPPGRPCCSWPCIFCPAASCCRLEDAGPGCCRRSGTVPAPWWRKLVMARPIVRGTVEALGTVAVRQRPCSSSSASKVTWLPSHWPKAARIPAVAVEVEHGPAHRQVDRPGADADHQPRRRPARRSPSQRYSCSHSRSRGRGARLLRPQPALPGRRSRRSFGHGRYHADVEGRVTATVMSWL